MIDALLVQQLTTLLAPVLPKLMEITATVGKKTLDTASEKVGEASWNKAVNTWNKLWPWVEKKPEVAGVLQDVAKREDDPRAEAILSWQLENVLADLPPETLSEIRNIVAEKVSETRVIAASSASVVIGGNASGNLIVTNLQSADKKQE
jgi:hypothetical protein